MSNRLACPASAALALALGLALFPAPARAEITADARRVVDRYLQVCGGRAAFESIRTTRTEAHLKALGLEGTTTTYAERPNRRASRTQLGPFSIPEGFDGTSGWRVDPSGKLIVLDAKELEDARSSAYFENQRWLDKDQGGGTITVAATESDSAARYTVLEITPPGGRPRRFWFNETTGLVDRESMKRDQQTVTGMLSDYRKTDGRLIAHHSVVRIQDMPANDLDITVDRVVVNEPIDPAVFRAPKAETSRIVWCDPVAQERRWVDMRFRYEARHVWVRASINGGPYADFLFDTGASITVLDSSYAASLGLATEGEMQSMGAGSTGSARFAKIQSLKIADDTRPVDHLADAFGHCLEFRDQQVAVLSVNPFLQPFFWKPCAGVIGADFISRVVTRIDYDEKTLTLYDPATFHYQGKGTAVPITLAGNIPVVKMKVDGGIVGDFRVDVGSSSTVDFHGPFAKQHAVGAKASKRLEVVSGGFGGTFTSTLTRLTTLAIGPYSWKQPMVSLSGASSGALASEDYAGNIGNQILERFTCTFDYDRRTLYLEPAARYAQRDRFSRAGVQLALMDSTVRAMQVLVDSPSYKAGLRETDEVVTIDGKPATSYTAESLRQLFEDGAVGRVVKMDIAQESGPKSITFKLADIL